MAKFCSNCGKELDNNASICLNCGVLVNNNFNINNKKEKKKGLPSWGIIIIIVGIIIVLPTIFITLIAVSSFTFMENTNSILEEIFEPETQNGTIGDTLLTEDFKIKLMDAKTYEIVGEGESIKEPKEGKEYLAFFLDIENISNETNSIYSYDFNGYIEEYSITEKNIETDIEGIEHINANLLPGTKAKGFIVFEVNKNWTEFELCYEDWYGSRIVFKVVNESKTNITGA